MRRAWTAGAFGGAVAIMLSLSGSAFAAAPLVGVATQNSVQGSGLATTEYNLQQGLIYGTTGAQIPHDYVVVSVAGTLLLAADPVYFYDPEED